MGSSFRTIPPFCYVDKCDSNLFTKYKNFGNIKLSQDTLQVLAMGVRTYLVTSPKPFRFHSVGEFMESWKN